jgi:hypothetical protein
MRDRTKPMRLAMGKTTLWILGFTAWGVTAAALSWACSPSSGSGAGSGPPPCGVDLDTMSIPDAEIHDSGATVVGCAACARANCATQLGVCNVDCACNATVVGYVACLADGGYKIGECLAPLTPGDNENDPHTTAVYTCLATCAQACGAP